MRHYRNQLEKQIQVISKQAVDSQITPLLDLTGISGHYIWETGRASAELDIKALGNNMVSVAGVALWSRPDNAAVNLGELDFIGRLSGKMIHYKDLDSEYEMTITFGFDALLVVKKKCKVNSR